MAIPFRSAGLPHTKVCISWECRGYTADVRESCLASVRMRHTWPRIFQLTIHSTAGQFIQGLCIVNGTGTLVIEFLTILCMPSYRRRIMGCELWHRFDEGRSNRTEHFPGRLRALYRRCRRGFLTQGQAYVCHSDFSLHRTTNSMTEPPE